METLMNPKETKANKEHRCNFCGERIIQGDKYMKSTHVADGEVYDWKSHKWCEKLYHTLDMYHDAGEDGVTQDYFMETVSVVHDDILIRMFTDDDAKKYSDVIQQLRHVRFRDKMSYVIRHYAKLEKETDANG